MRQTATAEQLDLAREAQAPLQNDNGNGNGQVPAIHEPEPTSLMALAGRLACEPNFDKDKFEALLAAAERQDARQSEQAFNAAMTAAQLDLKRVSADATNPQTKSAYASYPQLDRAIRPIYTKHGFALSFDTADGAPENCVRVVCYVSHKDGHSRSYHVDMPADGKGAKGGDVMTKTHATGAAFSYSMRYLLKMIFNVAVGEDDDDGNYGDGKSPINEQQRDHILGIIAKAGFDVAKFCSFMKVEAVADIRAKDYEKAIMALNEAERKKK